MKCNLERQKEIIAELKMMRSGGSNNSALKTQVVKEFLNTHKGYNEIEISRETGVPLSDVRSALHRICAEEVANGHRNLSISDLKNTLEGMEEAKANRIDSALLVDYMARGIIIKN